MQKNTIKALVAFILIVSGAFTLAFVGKGIDYAGMDNQTKPTDNFYQYANGKWIVNNPVPSAESRWGNFNIVSDRNNETLHAILTEAASGKLDADPEARKIGIFYRTYADTMGRNTAHISPLLEELNAVNDLQQKEEIMHLILRFHKKGVRSLFGFGISQDLKNSNAYIASFAQSGLGLPDRDYYLKNDPASERIRREYAAYITGAFATVTGQVDSSIAQTIIRFETELAKSSMSRVERRNAEKQYNKFSRDSFENRYATSHIMSYLQDISSQNYFPLLVSQPAFFDKIGTLYTTESIETWKMYLRWNLINTCFPYLSDICEKQHFHFYSTVLNGVKEQKPFWKKAINASNSIVGEMLGKQFVQRTFSQDSKRRVNEMVDNIMIAFRERLTKIDWMSAATKEQAIGKLGTFIRKLGYPDKWEDFAALEISEKSYLQNYFNRSLFNFNDMMSRWGKPVDKGEWHMLPQTVNAYYNPVNNEIVFPAAIMQKPFFTPEADEAVNYGTIGAVIGHEFLHGFDDQGSKYDKEGNLKSWWTEEDRTLFEARTKVLVEQFNSFTILDSVHVNGELTLGENIADLGGLTMAYAALKNYLKAHPKANVKIDGMTPEQRFFLGFGQVWRNTIRPEAARQLIITDPHSPPQFRVLGPLSNMPEFYEAFQVKPGDQMYRAPETRVKIW